MTKTGTVSKRRGGRGIRPWLLGPKLVGIVMFMGSLATLTVITLLGPTPQTIEGWRVLRETLGAVVLQCMLPGALVAIAFGIALFLQHPRIFGRLRWFQVKAASLVVLTTAGHFWSRSRVEAFDDALAGGRLEELAGLWRDIAVAFAAAFVLYLVVAALGRFKPRLWERAGSRRPAAPVSPQPDG